MGIENRSRPHSARRHRAIIVALLTTSGIAGCGYPEIGPAAYETAKALHPVMNDRDPAALARVRAHLATAHREQSLSESELELLVDLVELAEAGDWLEAERGVLDLLAAQND